MAHRPSAPIPSEDGRRHLVEQPSEIYPLLVSVYFSSSDVPSDSLRLGCVLVGTRRFLW